ncbi:MAG: membrane dipeptidase [Cognaticolwellia sp.]|jgi:membrane dipeptidase
MKILQLLVIIILLSSCVAQNSDESLHKLADKLAHDYIITDGHVDLPYRLRVQNFRLEKEYIGIPIETDKGDFDYVRAKKGGLDAPFMSIYIPARLQEEGGAKELADTLITMVKDIAAAYPDKFGIAYTPEDVRNFFEKGIISLPMGMENGAPIGDDLANLTYFRKRGISYITLTHSKDNQICDSSYDEKRTWKGLSPYGKKVVEEMNRVGIMVDISHVSDETFYQVIELTKVPVIASHSSCRKYTPYFERNMDDDMIRKMKTNGGVIQINFGSSFLDATIGEQNDALRNSLDSILTGKGLEHKDEAAKSIIEKFKKDNPKLFSDVEMVANHIDHVVALAGIDHVGLGSDFDGVGDSLPTGLKDVSQYPNLIYVLLKRGYTKEDIEKICYKNVFRVWQTVLDYSEK